MIALALPAPRSAAIAAIAAGFSLQALILARRGESGAIVAVVIFVGLALGALSGARAFQGLVSASAALGGLGMAAGESLQGLGHGMAHSSMAEGPPLLLSWSGLLMIAGCTLACALLPDSHRSSRQWLFHHGATLAGMSAGMILPHALAGLTGISPPAWALHVAMVAAMAGAGRLALALARTVDRRAFQSAGSA